MPSSPATGPARRRDRRLADPRPVRRRRQATRRRPFVGSSAKEKRALVSRLADTRPVSVAAATRAGGRASASSSGSRCAQLVVEVTFDHASGGRIRHGTKILRWREDKAPKECLLEQMEG